MVLARGERENTGWFEYLASASKTDRRIREDSQLRRMRLAACVLS